MKKHLIVIFAIMIFIFMPTKAKALDLGYEINNYHVTMEVSENGQYHITETIDVFFNLPSRGIYRNLITNSKINFGNLDGEEVIYSYYFPIKDITVEGHPYSKEYEGDGISLRIGDPDVYLKGNQRFVIHYTVQSKDLGDERLGQLLYYNFNGASWDTYIHQFSFEINYPKPVNPEEFRVYVGNVGSTNTSKAHCDFNNDYKQTSCFIPETLNPGESVTALQKLSSDNSYITYPDYSTSFYIVLGISGLLVAFSLISFFKYGKDEPLVKTIEFGPPVGFNSAEVGYVYDDVVDNKDVLSLILEWAKNGYIIIKDDDGAVSFIKVRDLSNQAADYERKMFNRLFKSGDEVATKDLKEKFYTAIQQCQHGVKRTFKKKGRVLYDKKSLQLQGIVMILSALPIALVVFVGLWNNYLRGIAFLSIIIVLIQGIVNGSIIYSFKRLRKNKGKTISVLATIIMAFITMVVGFVIYVLTATFDIAFNYMVIAIIMSIIMAALAFVMDRRSDYGRRVYGQVLGLEEFIRFAHKHQLDMMVKENPYIFYDILPYAYAFDLTDVWSEQFKDLQIPEVEFYQTTNRANVWSAYWFSRSFNNSMRYASSNLTAIPAPKSSSGKFGGGGSFGGSGGGFGGGSAGGGFGGGGGGRW